MGSSFNSYGTLKTNLKEMSNNSDPLDTIEYMGICGETAAHISVYKSDLTLVDMILRNGFHPNTKNHVGDTIMHTAAKVGDLAIMKRIYETNKCDLDIQNNDGASSLDICNRTIQEKDIFELRVFRNWRRDDFGDITTTSIMHGRKKCAQFLSEKVQIDRLNKTKQIMGDTIAYNNRRLVASRAIRGISSERNYRSYTDLNYPQTATASWPEEDVRFFEEGWGYAVGFQLVITRVFACEYVHRSIKVGFRSAYSELRRREDQLEERQKENEKEKARIT